MSKLKCPICGVELEHYHSGFVCYRHCLNDKNVWGSEETLKELDRTRKALDKAIWWLNEIVENHRFTPISTAEMALKEITALEQKEE